MLTEEQDGVGPETARQGQGNQSGTRRRRPPTREDLDGAYDAAERAGALASGLALVLRVAGGPLSPALFAALPPLGPVLVLAREEEAKLYRLAHAIEVALS